MRTSKLEREVADLSRRVRALEAVMGFGETLVCCPVGVRVKAIQERLAARNGLTLGELLGPRRDYHLVAPRHQAIYLARELTGAGNKVLGKLFHRDAKAVYHAIAAVRNRMDTEPAYAGDIAAWLRELETEDEHDRHQTRV